MTKETLDLIKELFEMIKNQKEYSDILNKQTIFSERVNGLPTISLAASTRSVILV